MKACSAGCKIDIVLGVVQSRIFGILRRFATLSSVTLVLSLVQRENGKEAIGLSGENAADRRRSFTDEPIDDLFLVAIINAESRTSLNFFYLARQNTNCLFNRLLIGNFRTSLRLPLRVTRSFSLVLANPFRARRCLRSRFTAYTSQEPIQR